jgi:hypothetical protein
METLLKEYQEHEDLWPLDVFKLLLKDWEFEYPIIITKQGYVKVEGWTVDKFKRTLAKAMGVSKVNFCLHYKGIIQLCYDDESSSHDDFFELCEL